MCEEDASFFYYHHNRLLDGGSRNDSRCRHHRYTKSYIEAYDVKEFDTEENLVIYQVLHE